MENVILSPAQKALNINLDEHIYGTFSEIGAGQEVVRHFFRAGGASGTIAKAMSAYDMDVSDATMLFNAYFSLEITYCYLQTQQNKNE